eukprot:gene25145-4410_t
MLLVQSMMGLRQHPKYTEEKDIAIAEALSALDER